jgi:hypothetical protein
MHNRELRLGKVDTDQLKTQTCIESSELFIIGNEGSASRDLTLLRADTTVTAGGNDGNW